MSGFNAGMSAGAIRVTLTGDWDRLHNTFQYLNTNYKLQAVQLNQQQAQKTKDAIETNVFNLTGKPHGTGIWWIDTLELMSNLEVKKTGGADSAFFIGFGDGLHSHRGKYPISYNSIAEILESEHPLIKPTWESLKGDFLEEWQNLVLKATRGGV